MNQPLVSVIIPNYNYSASLSLCIDALRAQTYQPIEILVVDDHSTDDSVEVARSLGARVVVRESNGGCAAARNTGIEHARGEILFFVDSDVAPAPDAVAESVRVLSEEPGLGAVCGVEDWEPLIRDSLLEEYRGLQFHYWSAGAQGDVSFLFPAMCAIRREVVAEVGAFNPALKQTEEVDYGNRLSARYPIRLTGAVHGRHDHDAELATLLRKLFHRGRARVPLYARAPRLGRGFESRSRVLSSLLATGAVVTSWLPAVAGPIGAVVPLALFAASIALDGGMYRWVFDRKGPVFLVYFTAVHLVVNVTITVAVGAGAVQWLLSPRFRAIYDAPPPALMMAVTA